ncbi:helix-turn-helix domain-containing protein (plasmid) [Cytobacillus spongiae]|uniref:helix-turn-helix domain-containing protein n=1 Tax=Cytobacillus spongiae TaxID=2901381 RepID=UPI001CD434CD|nr:helix-turn-helix transcriptional regulator [Cytobacillus spongiae]MCA1062647.1 helix-turn-helix domain-containing protein [Rossellomorea aquimaris]UII58284.1 helix-turn-helix domain-containing protein [Cytobacillus spongiae]WJV28687.1 helix-turn-helix transcriptional regulator [Rossellomorea sp. AcN35-11]
MNDMKKLCNSINSCLISSDSPIDEWQMGEIIQMFRVKSHLTQGELARRANVSSQTIKRIEGGNVRVSDITCRGIFEALGVNISLLTELLDEEPERRMRE